MAAAEGVDVEESEGLVALVELEAGDVSWSAGVANPWALVLVYVAHQGARSGAGGRKLL